MKNRNSFIGIIEMTMVSVGILSAITLAAVWTRLGDLTGVLGVSSVSVTIQNDNPSVGSVVSTLAGFDCGTSCERDFNQGDTVSLIAIGNQNRQVGSWSLTTASGADLLCKEGLQGGEVCSFDVPDSAITVAVNWSYSQYNLSVAKSGNGSGVVTGPGLNCGDDCVTSWGAGSSVSINAIPDAGSVFAGWQAPATDCSSTSTECTISSSSDVQNKTAIAKFVLDAEEPPEDAPAETPSESNSAVPDESVSQVPPTVNPIVLRDSAGNVIQWSEDSPAIFQPGEPINLGSTTEPGTIVRLYIFSDPMEVVVNADDDGDWAYSITDIESGDHRVEMELENPTTGATSDRQQVLSFTVANQIAADTPETVELDPVLDPLSWQSIVVQLVVPMVVVVALFFTYRYIVKTRPLG